MHNSYWLLLVQRALSISLTPQKLWIWIKKKKRLRHPVGSEQNSTVSKAMSTTLLSWWMGENFSLFLDDWPRTIMFFGCWVEIETCKNKVSMTKWPASESCDVLINQILQLFRLHQSQLPFIQIFWWTSRVARQFQLLFVHIWRSKKKEKRSHS